VYNAELELDLHQVSIHTTENTQGWPTVLNDIIMENQKQHTREEGFEFMNNYGKFRGNATVLTIPL
jgi:hypothetical protein